MSILIALFAAYIAYQQHRIEKRKFKLELYEKRYKVYKALMTFLGTIMREGRVTNDSQREFLINTNESLFFFDKNVNEYLKEIYSKSCDKWLCDVKLDDQNMEVGEERTRIANRNHELTLWLVGQLKEAEIIFGKYLSFEE